MLNGKKVLVTGGAGFIGSHLVDELIAQGAEVVVYDNLKRGKKENLNKKAAFVHGDVCNPIALAKAMNGCELVFHYAAQSNVMGSIADRDYTFNTNVVGTYNALNQAYSAGIKRFIFSSSREVYGEASSLPVPETHKKEPKNPYGSSKVIGEALCSMFHEVYGFSAASLRFANVYGPRDFGRVIPLFIKRARNNETLEIYGGEQFMDFVYVDDAVRASIRAIEISGLGGKAINVGSGTGIALQGLAEKIISLVGSSSKVKTTEARSVEVKKFVADITLMEKMLCSPRIPLETGLKAMVCSRV